MKLKLKLELNLELELEIHPKKKRIHYKVMQKLMRQQNSRLEQNPLNGQRKKFRGGHKI
jgi:hypothetical protein